MLDERSNLSGAPRASISYREALGVLLSAPNGWSMAFVAFVMAMIPIVGMMALMGWMGEITRRSVLRHPHPVPPLNFSDFGYWIGRGVTPFVTNMAVSFAIGMGVNLVVFPAMFLMAAAGAAGGEGDTLMIMVLLGSFGFAMLAAFALTLLLNAMLLVAELTGNLSAVFSWAPLKTFLGQTLWMQISTTFVMGAIMTVLGGLSIFTLFLGLVFVIPVGMVAAAHIRAQIYQVNLGRGGLAMVIEPPAPCPTERQLYGLGA